MVVPSVVHGGGRDEDQKLPLNVFTNRYEAIRKTVLMSFLKCKQKL